MEHINNIPQVFLEKTSRREEGISPLYFLSHIYAEHLFKACDTNIVAQPTHVFRTIYKYTHESVMARHRL